MLATKIGETKRIRKKIILSKEKETQKAIALKIVEEIDRKTRVDTFEGIEWLPKSQIEEYEEWISAPRWLLEEKNLPIYIFTCLLASTELMEKTGLSLACLTLKNYVELTKKGMAKAEIV